MRGRQPALHSCSHRGWKSAFFKYETICIAALSVPNAYPRKTSLSETGHPRAPKVARLHHASQRGDGSNFPAHTSAAPEAIHVAAASNGRFTPGRATASGGHGVIGPMLLLGIRRRRIRRHDVDRRFYDDCAGGSFGIGGVLGRLLRGPEFGGHRCYRGPRRFLLGFRFPGLRFGGLQRGGRTGVRPVPDRACAQHKSRCCKPGGYHAACGICIHITILF